MSSDEKKDEKKKERKENGHLRRPEIVQYLCFAALCYRNLLIQWQQQFAPQSPDEDPDPRFLEAIHNLEIVEYELDTLLTGADFEKKQIVRDFFQERNSQKEGSGLEPIIKAPIYPHSSAYARERGELDLFRESYQANISCKKDIEKSISGHFDGMRLDPEGAAEILKRYGPDRVSLVLAATVQLKAWDGRFSSANKDWAFTFDFPDAQTARGFDRRNDYAVSSHPAILDGFISQVRQEIKALEKAAVNDTEKQAVNPTVQPSKRKNQEMER